MSRMQLFFMAVGLMYVAASCSRSPMGKETEQAEPRGKYLVERVAMCADCHTPRDRSGGFDRTQWLQGSSVDFHPIHELPNWAEKAPGIAGLPELGDAAVIRLLETGLPQYRMSHDDAAAVTDYLKSLPAGAR